MALLNWESGMYPGVKGTLEVDMAIVPLNAETELTVSFTYTGTYRKGERVDTRLTIYGCQYQGGERYLCRKSKLDNSSQILIKLDFKDGKVIGEYSTVNPTDYGSVY